MRRAVASVLIAALVGAGAAAAGAQGPLPLPELLRVAEKLTGVKPKLATKVVVVSPAALRARAQATLDRRYPAAEVAYDTELYRALGLLGPQQQLEPLLRAAWLRPGAPLLDAGARTVYVRSGAAARTAALAGLVQALYAQRYGVGSPVPGDEDASLAGAAAAAGAADLALHRLRIAPPGPPRPSSTAGAFLGIRSQFVDDVGLRLASTLLDVGGDRAVRWLLQRPPVSTEQVLHVDKYLENERPAPMELPADPAGFTPVRDDTFGELDVRALLAVFQVPRLDRVGAGWGGGRSAVYRDGTGRDAVALRLDWDTPADAAEWTDAVGTYVDQAFDADVPGPPAAVPCAADSCWSLAGRSIAYAHSGGRTALVFGASVDAAAALASALTT